MCKFFRRKTMMVDKQRCSEHFSYNEMIASQTATRNNIDNTPNEQQYYNLTQLCRNILEPIRQHYNLPIFINSGFRCLELNRKIGSTDKSQHMKGQAADLFVNTIFPFETWKWLVTESDLDYDQAIAEFTTKTGGGWLHVSYDSENNRNKITIARKDDGRTIYTHYIKRDILNEKYFL